MAFIDSPFIGWFSASKLSSLDPAVFVEQASSQPFTAERGEAMAAPSEWFIACLEQRMCQTISMSGKSKAVRNRRVYMLQLGCGRILSKNT